MEEFKVELENLTNEERKTLLKLVEKWNKSNKRWRGKRDDTYYSVSTSGNIITDIDCSCAYDEKCYRLGNYFKTKEEAEFVRKKQLIYQQLKDYALEHNTKDFDWDNEYLNKFCIAYDYQDNDLFIDFMQTTKYPNTVYFTSKEIAENAIKEIGEDRIKKYLFEIE